MTTTSAYLARVRAFAVQYPDRTALSTVGDDGLDLWSYGATWGAICSGSQRLTQAGVEVGQRLAILGDTEPAWGVAELAAMHCGAIVVPLDPCHPDTVLRSILQNSAASGILASKTQAERARGLLGDAALVIEFGQLFDRETDAGRDTPFTPVDPDHPRLLVYTSGTTGTPKGVTLTERNLTSQLDSILQVVPLAEDEKLLSILPLNHMFAQIVNLLGPLYAGASVLFAREATPQAVRTALERGGVTAFGAVPQFFALFRDRVLSEIESRGSRAVRAHRFLIGLSRIGQALGWRSAGRRLFPAIHRAFGGRLRWIVSGGAYLDPQLGRQLTDWGFDLLVAYGLTEATAAVTVTPPGKVDVRTVGQPLPGVELRIAHPDDKGVGEILVRGPSVMTGYWGRADATAEAIDDEGWLSTGDLGSIEADGNLIIRGRAKEMIVLASGENVFPQELDEHYAGHPLIREVCVVGLPVTGGGERLHAVVVPDLDEFRRKQIPTVEDYVRFEMENLALELPSYQRVRSYTIWREPLPRTPTRKVRRLEVCKTLLERQELCAVATRTFTFTPEDRECLEHSTFVTIIEAGRLRERDVDPIHPDMNLEFDLGLDSLARAEMIAHLTTSFEIDPDVLASALTLREMAQALDATTERGGPVQRPTGNASRTIVLDNPEAEQEAARRLPEIRGWRALGRVVGGLGLRAMVKGYFKLRVVGTEHLPRSERPYVLVVNHISWGDPFFVAAALPDRIRRDVFYLGYAGQLRGWLRGLGSKAFHVIPVDAGRRLTRALQLGAAGLRMGRILMIFPEGERTVDGQLRAFKPGTALLIRHTGAPAVPVAVIGAHEIWGRDKDRPLRGKVTVAFGRPIDFSAQFTDDVAADHARITEMLEEQVRALIDTHTTPR